jgi:DNA-binding response OmpR family regulator
MGKTILVVDDDEALRNLYEEAFSKEGFSVLTAHNGKTAIEVSHQKPDLILLDVGLPDMNGVDILSFLKADEQTKEIPVIILTNFRDEPFVNEALKLGAKGYLLKMEYTQYQVVEHVKHVLSDQDRTWDTDPL